MTDLRSSWEDRAAGSGSELSGVLFRGLSNCANVAIHDWHSWLILNVLLPKLPDGACILDLGSGYGRLSSVVRGHRPDLVLIGQDFVQTYCQQYLRNYGSSVQADVRMLPFADQSFDGIVAVTSLMYVERKDIQVVLGGILRVLRPGGYAFFLDPGYEIQSVISTIRGSRAASPTGGMGFRVLEYSALAESAGFKILSQGGNLETSLALLVPGVATSNGSLVRALLGRAARRDCVQDSGYSKLSLHRWLFVMRSGSASC